ncbi:protease inhibitor I42 family protein [Rhodococcus coprophilus]|nr:protease inhibitor I42 family protein [Rhodococcus coprophilus]MBM7461146.1 inhibitor of cysteine peptidase [Rhodococcus coprophilus]
MKHIRTGPQDLTVDVGDMIELHMEESTSRDYCWFTSRVGAGLVLHDVRFVPSKNPLPGAGGERVFYLKASRVGRWPVALRMRRLADLDADRAYMTVDVT